MSVLEGWLFGVPDWIVYLVAFLLPCAEAAVFAGFVVPGETGLLIAGVLAGLGHVDPVAVAVCGVAGALVGDSIGFGVGRRLGPRLRSSRLGRLVGPARWERAEGFIVRYGGGSVFLGRWVGFGRALIPALVGATGMGYRRFLVWNALGGTTWAVVVTAVGYFAGGSWRRVERVFGPAVFLVVVAVIALAVLVVAARWVARHPRRVRDWARRQASRPGVRAALARYDRQARWLSRRFEPHTVLGLQLTTGLALIVAGGWLFGAVLQDVIVGEEAVRGDLPILRWLAGHRDDTLTAVVVPVHRLAGAWGALALAVTGALLVRGRARNLVLTVSAWGGAVGSALSVSVLVGRSGPPAAYALAAVPGTGSFPAPGIAATTAVAGVLAFLASGRARSWARAVAYWTAAVLWVGAAGAVAAYLGAVWVTDVLGGWTLGALLSAILLTSAAPWARPSAPDTAPPRTPPST
ncbi:VTT domain-containing protein [Nocardiopsis sp. CT-R113]|uniref:VTT domain-containing protein n=1 Tax=Nocardiopsis codii TaxID=3065942 RepID=A0ABU7KGM3_9ACTN|nr:VTT domain-containing protein [Nocardiopsis sp. CT-R113]MEE2041390.1 VTT domain-containing protein [Nocardiopsis sp. CT-R113]